MSESTAKPAMIGIYGVSGCGKSYRFNKLKAPFPSHPSISQNFEFLDGSTLIDQVLPGGLLAFKKMAPEFQAAVRESALSLAEEQCRSSGKTGVIAGHYMFWESNSKDEAPERIGTEKDWSTYTHMVYLDVDATVIAQRRNEDKTRQRNELSVERLRAWQKLEKEELRAMCRERGILFTVVSEDTSSTAENSVERLAALLTDLRTHDEEVNEAAVSRAVDEALKEQDAGVDTMFLFDADKTLAPADTGHLFWDEVSAESGDRSGCTVSRIFKDLGYSYFSFRQATLLYEERASEFDAVCEKVARKVELYPEMRELLRRVADTPHTGAMIVTCGLRAVWEKVLQRYNISGVKIIGGGRVSDGYVVTGSTKRDVVDMLHGRKKRVVAFGDSPLDIDMLTAADSAYVVVGPECNRSKSMDSALSIAINKDGLAALQILLPTPSSSSSSSSSTSAHSHRLDLSLLPATALDEAELTCLLHRPKPHSHIVHATHTPAAKLLMTPTRDARLSSHALRAAHHRIGFYLATTYLSAVLGVEEISIPHVQGNKTSGHRIRHEKATLIIPLMRGGEPMAFGVSEAMPLAGFAHAKNFSDIDPKNLDGKRTIVLVDSVINTGSSIVDFVAPLRRKMPFVRVVVVAGVVQENAVVVKGIGMGPSRGEDWFAEMLRRDSGLWLVALRTSENRYKGRGGTDTGHRLFNTTKLD